MNSGIADCTTGPLSSSQSPRGKIWVTRGLVTRVIMVFRVTFLIAFISDLESFYFGLELGVRGSLGLNLFLCGDGFFQNCEVESR